MTEPSHNLTVPSIADVFRERAARLQWLRAKPERFIDVKRYYATHWADFINDWGCTVDPRLAARSLPTVIPFTLWAVQREWIDYVLAQWRAGKPGVIRKSRDMGATWLAASLSTTMMLPDIGMPGLTIGFGSRKEDLVDNAGDPNTIFHKIRSFLANLPVEFRGAWSAKKHSAHMRVVIPETEGACIGEAGDNIGRGGRTAIYWVDEAAHIERPQLVEASLSANTDCRIDISSVNGPANPFAEKLTNGKFKVFDMSWRADPRKLIDPEWEQKKRDELGDEVFEQEYGGNINASQEGVICPAKWVSAAVDAHVKLNIKASGARLGSLDVADRGVDKNAWGYRYGVVLEHAESWSGKDSDIYATTERAFLLGDTHRVSEWLYDGDGLGAGVRGDARKINEARTNGTYTRTEQQAAQLEQINTHGARMAAEMRKGLKAKAQTVNEFRGSAGVMFPEHKVLGPDGKPLERSNEDMFLNYKAQGWWTLRFRLQQTWRALNGFSYDPSMILSISSAIGELPRLLMELSQPVYKLNGAGKIVVDKLPDGALSPNLADMVMMLYAPRRTQFNVTDDILSRLS